LAPGLTIAGGVAGLVVGLGVTVLVVNIRSLLHDRAVLDRWAGDLMASLRSAVEEFVATRVLVAESVLSTELAALDEAENTQVTDRVGAIDSELREHAIAAARAASVRDREMPTVQGALDAVRAELGDPGITKPEDQQNHEDAAGPASRPDADTGGTDTSASRSANGDNF
jgi:hypothetical protein